MGKQENGKGFQKESGGEVTTGWKKNEERQRTLKLIDEAAGNQIILYLPKIIYQYI